MLSCEALQIDTVYVQLLLVCEGQGMDRKIDAAVLNGSKTRARPALTIIIMSLVKLEATHQVAQICSKDRVTVHLCNWFLIGYKWAGSSSTDTKKLVPCLPPTYVEPDAWLALARRTWARGDL